jgi:hypothetical protein
VASGRSRVFDATLWRGAVRAAQRGDFMRHDGQGQESRVFHEGCAAVSGGGQASSAIPVGRLAFGPPTHYTASVGASRSRLASRRLREGHTVFFRMDDSEVEVGDDCDGAVSPAVPSESVEGRAERRGNDNLGGQEDDR